jgi:hypothetical protein
MSACVPAQANKAYQTARLTWTAVAAIALIAASVTPAFAQYNSGIRPRSIV